MKQGAEVCSHTAHQARRELVLVRRQGKVVVLACESATVSD